MWYRVGVFCLFLLAAAAAQAEKPRPNAVLNFVLEIPGTPAKEIDVTVFVQPADSTSLISRSYTDRIPSKPSNRKKSIPVSLNDDILKVGSLVVRPIASVAPSEELRPLPIAATIWNIVDGKNERSIPVYFGSAVDVFGRQGKVVDDVVSDPRARSTSSQDITNFAPSMLSALIVLSDMYDYAANKADPRVWQRYYVLTMRSFCELGKIFPIDRWPANVSLSIEQVEEKITKKSLDSAASGDSGQVSQFSTNYYQLLFDRISCINRLLSNAATNIAKETRSTLLAVAKRSPFEEELLTVEQKIRIWNEQLYTFVASGEASAGIEYFRLLCDELQVGSAANATATVRRTAQLAAGQGVELFKGYLDKNYKNYRPAEAIKQDRTLDAVNECLKPFKLAFSN